MCLQSTGEARSASKSVVIVKMSPFVCFPFVWYGENSPIKQGRVEKQESALSEVVIGGSAVDSLNCSSVAISMRARCVCARVRCAVGMYRKTGGGEGHEIKCNSGREFINSTKDWIQHALVAASFLRGKKVLIHVCFRLGFF